MKEITQREGFLNRHTDPLPKEKTTISIVYKDVDGEHVLSCEWNPFDKKAYTNKSMPAIGYLGTARTINPPCQGIGFHVWKQNNSEFIYYKIITHDVK